MLKKTTVFLIFFCTLITCGAGYMGTLPDLEGEFDYKRNTPSVSAPKFNAEPVKTGKELKPIPRQDKSYLEIILTKDKTTEYTKDMSDVIPCLEKLQSCIENKKGIQIFNGIISNLIDNVQYIQNKYLDRPESSYLSYRALIILAEQAREVAELRTHAHSYTKYLPYSSTGSEYKAENVNNKIKALEDSVNETLYVLKHLD